MVYTMSHDLKKTYPEVSELVRKQKHAFYSGFNYPEISSIPGCKFIGPTLRTNRFYQEYAAYVKMRCPIFSLGMLPTLTPYCQELYAHLFGAFGNLGINSDYENVFMPAIIGRDNLLRDSLVAGFLVDNLFILAEGTPIERVLWYDPISDLDKVIAGLGTAEAQTYNHNFNLRCARALHATIKVQTIAASKIWNDFGCTTVIPLGEAFDPFFMYTRNSLGNMLMPIGKTIDSIQTAGGINSLPPVNPYENLSRSWHTMVSDMEKAVAGFSAVELRAVAMGRCPLDQVLSWTRKNLLNDRFAGSLYKLGTGALKTWGVLVEFLLNKDLQYPELA